MNVRRLVLREIAHRKLNFAMGLLSVAVAVGCYVGADTLLQADAIRTERAGRELEDAMRKITKGLGFNILILPEDQDVGELHVEGTLSKTMPDEYVRRLAESKIVTINHLLPVVTRKVRWEQLDETIYLIGTRGEVPFAHRDPKKPLQDRVPRGEMIVGHHIHTAHDLEAGQTVSLLGREFTVGKLKDEQGNRDDGTVWINLAEAQELLGLENLVHGILALECNCAAEDRIGQIRDDIAGILPGTQVIESGPPALARAEARNRAKQTAEESLKRHDALAGVLVPLIVAGCGVWIALLAFGNVRQRAPEIGILRAVGLRSRQILAIFLGKAAIIGILGAVAGYLAGFTLGMELGQLAPASWADLFAPGPLAAVLVAAPLLAAAASWIPAVLAARQDPAVILHAE